MNNTCRTNLAASEVGDLEEAEDERVVLAWVLDGELATVLKERLKDLVVRWREMEEDDRREGS